MDINIRNVPEELAKSAKIAAVMEGKTLREFVIEAVERAIVEKASVQKRAQ